MPIKKAKGVLRIEFLDTHPDQVLLADYLRATGDAKGRVLAATKAALYALALAKQADVSHQDLEMALAQTMRDLDRQKSYVLDYYRVFKHIELPSESSAVNRLISVPERMMSSGVPEASGVKQVETTGAEAEEEGAEGEEEEENKQCLIQNPDLYAKLNF